VVHIIIADDEEGILRLLKMAIEITFPSYTISTVNNGQKALQLYERSGADLIILNYGMPVMPGPDLARTLRAKGVTIPIVMTSANPWLAQKSYEAGATLFIETRNLVKKMSGVLSLLLPF
jgi:CheY-like chemotaxis protein